MTDRLDCVGRKEICEYLGCTWITARKKLIRLGLYSHDGRKPILSKIAYTKAILRIHLNQD
jgi:hypothetical protein